ncbi:peptide deformylase [Paenibacillus catalpae]|uniref:Peptide deformylase n=1 Tax=Paenibacillus catalpae TaxID=1045775 RepID=A0A1I2GKN0_9BACL|nr:peptide deformylase [Paenibacillus catalpae]SFF17530.1 peptide deformylase [Paenibacillus catalpae]
MSVKLILPFGDPILRKTAKPVVETITLEGEGYLARCMQHEIDHLNGVLFVDHVQDRWLYHEESQQKVNVWDVRKLTNQAFN